MPLKEKIEKKWFFYRDEALKRGWKVEDLEQIKTAFFEGAYYMLSLWQDYSDNLMYSLSFADSHIDKKNTEDEE